MSPRHLTGYGPFPEKKAEEAVAWILSNDVRDGVAWTVLLDKWHTDTKTPTYYREEEVRRTVLRMEKAGFIEKFKVQYSRSNWWRLTDEGLDRYFCRECGEPRGGGCHGGSR